MLKRLILLLALLLLQVRVPALAWDDFGHMAVAGIAYKRLEAQVKVKADRLVKLNPHYRNWLKLLPQQIAPEEVSMYTFMLASTWPDAIKGDAEYRSDGLDNGYRPDGLTSSLNIGYSDKWLHKYWHFIDLPISADGARLPPVPSPNAEDEIAVCRAAIASNLPDEVKSYDLSWLLHLVGDVHQPLHCVTRVSKSMPYGDSGGNAVKIYDSEPPVLLHSFWDQVLGTERSPVMPFIAELPPGDEDKVSDLNCHDWVEESFALCKSKVYISPVKKGTAVKRLTPAYKKTAYNIAKVRVELAGERLANLLNAELK